MISTDNSPRGTRRPRTPKPLTIQEICAILRIASQTGVSSFKYQGLEAVFGVQRPQWGGKVPSTDPEVADKIAEDTLVQQELDTKQQQLEEMVLADPAAYEEMLLSEDLVNADEGQ